MSFLKFEGTIFFKTPLGDCFYILNYVKYLWWKFFVEIVVINCFRKKSIICLRGFWSRIVSCIFFMHCKRNYMKIQKQSFANVLQNFIRKQLRWNFFLIKLKSLSLATLWKKTPTQVFSCEISEVFKNTFFYSIPRVAAF